MSDVIAQRQRAVVAVLENSRAAENGSAALKVVGTNAQLEDPTRHRPLFQMTL